MTAEEIQKPGQITPAVAEQKVSAAVEDVVDENTAIETDGDFFWVIQRIAWGIIKTLLVLTVIGTLVWVIWGGNLPSFRGNSSPQIETPKPAKAPTSQATETSIQAPPVQNVTIDNGLTIESLAYQLARQNTANTTGSTITDSTSWLRQVKIIGDVSTDLLRTANPTTRADQIEATIRASEDLLNQSPRLQRRISEEFNFFIQRGETANQEVMALDTQISQSLGTFDGAQVEALLSAKISAQQNAANNLAQAKVLQTLLRNVQNFDRLLRQKSIPLLQPTDVRANPR